MKDAAARDTSAEVVDLTPKEVEALAEAGPDAEGIDDVAQRLHAEAVEATTRDELAREAFRRVARIEYDVAAEVGLRHARIPPRLEYPRWGWRRAVTFAVQRRMYTPEYLNLYRRFAWRYVRARATRQHVVFQGMVFQGKRVEFRGRPGHGRLILGPWCWIGNDNKLRAHEGQLTLGAKVVMGRDNVVNTYLDIEMCDYSLYADWIYICDFDHRFDRFDIPLKDQGIVKSPVRIGPDVWVGQKASILRGVDIGMGSVIASHALVNKDIPPFSIAVGLPARVVKSRLPDGMTPEEAIEMLRKGEAIPGDPLEG